MPLDEIPEGYFQGGAHLTESDEPVAIPRKPTLRVILNEVVDAINQLQAAPAGETVKVNLADAVAALLEDKVLAGTGISVAVVDKGGGDLAIEISAPGSTTDEKVRVTIDDTTAGLLADKVVDAKGNPLPVYGAGGDEKLQLPAAGTGWVYVADVTALGGGAVSGKTWQDTGSTVLQSCISSTTDIRMSVRSSYPLVKVGGATTELARDAGGGFYAGDVDVTFAGGDIAVTAVTPDDGDGAEDTISVTVELPPTITAANFQGGYPGSQTEVKEDDHFEISVVADKDFDRVRVLDYEACKLEEFAVSPAANYKVVDATVADRGDTAVPRPARVQVRDSVTGAWSDTRDTNFGGGSTDGIHVVSCNNLHPSVSIGAVTYPATQQALKGSESATVVNTLANYDSVAYDDPTTSELSIANPSAYEDPKTATRVGGTYNVSTANFRVTANRAANDSTTVDQAVVQIAAVAPTISVLVPAARLRSGGNDGTSAQNHTITISSDQLLLSADMDEDTGGGTFLGSWAGTPPDATWTRALQVHDDDAKGTYNWQNLAATNLAGIVQNAIDSGGSYVLGGFVQRDLTFAAFATTTQMDVEVVDFSKLQAGIFTATSNPAIKQSIGTPPPVTDGYTINSLGAKPTTVIWLDTTTTKSNSSGTAQITDVEEVV